MVGRSKPLTLAMKSWFVWYTKWAMVIFDEKFTSSVGWRYTLSNLQFLKLVIVVTSIWRWYVSYTDLENEKRDCLLKLSAKNLHLRIFNNISWYFDELFQKWYEFCLLELIKISQYFEVENLSSKMILSSYIELIFYGYQRIYS